MNIISVNVGKPADHTLDGVTVKTSMVRHAVSEIKINKFSVEGDEFAVPKYHGRPDSVVYALSADRYPEWELFLNKKFPIGSLGENLTIDILREEEIFLGDIYQAGSALLKATGPRYPCNRLNFVSGNKNMQSEFEKRNYPGVYFEVIKEGVTRAGDQLKLFERPQSQCTVTDLYKAMRDKKKNRLNLADADKLLKCGQLDNAYLKFFT